MKHLGQDPADSILASYTPDMAEAIDTLEDRVKERLAKMKAMNPAIDLDQLAKLTAQVVEQTIKCEGDSQMLRNRRDDTLDEALLALATNRSPDSLTAIAKRYINPTTGKPYTRAAISARLSELTQRTGLVLRIQRSERVRQIYKERAKRVHERRRKECPKWNTSAWAKGINRRSKCK
jgi:gentisate 1,2-dioxygenase